MAPIVPHSLAGAHALIEHLLPVQKLSAESYKEQMAVHGKTLTALGSYWKGRKPLILAKACVLGCLLPATGNNARDLEIFEMLMAMDDASFVVRMQQHPLIDELLTQLTIPDTRPFFDVTPAGALPPFAPLRLDEYGTITRLRGDVEGIAIQPHDRKRGDGVITVTWRNDLPLAKQRILEARLLPNVSYRERVSAAKRPEEMLPAVHAHIWEAVNAHLGTDAQDFPALVEQLGVMRWGHRPRVADVFCGSGQIPFEAARLGCDVYASDLNPIAAMLTWGAFNIVGGSPESREALEAAQLALVKRVQGEIDALGIEEDGAGWRGKVYLYCVEVKCPQTGWMVPLLPTRVVSKGYRVVAELLPDPVNKRYEVVIRTGVSDAQLKAAEMGTVRTETRGADTTLVHSVDGREYRTKISTLRGDYRDAEGNTGNKLRPWEVGDFKPRPDDIFQERLYAMQWMRPKENGSRFDYEFRSVTEADLAREHIVEEYVATHLADWQARGWVPDMRIEPGYNTDQPIRERNWTHWHHLFNPRQLLLGGLINRHSDAKGKLGLTQALNVNCRLSRWNQSGGGGGIVAGAFDNQALNTLSNYGCRGFNYLAPALHEKYGEYPLAASFARSIDSKPATDADTGNDIYITDPPYGDAVKYEEITEFFIAWLRKNPPPEFAGWVWDSRRSLAIAGEGHAFRMGMAAAYKRMAEKMPDNGIQVIMFTHTSGVIWAEMANIVWAAGLQVFSAWYVATEAERRIDDSGAYVKGTVLLVVRKRQGQARGYSSDIGFEIEQDVAEQVRTLTGLNQQAKGLYRDENLFEDADLQMAAYAAALKRLTQYAVIDGRDMAVEALQPRVKGQKTFVDELIEFAVETANRLLVPRGILEETWGRLNPAERFYLKLLEMEAGGVHTLDNYQNFAKAFKVADFHALLASERANQARLKSAAQFGKNDMGEASELHDTPLRALLYALWELGRNLEMDVVLAHLQTNVSTYLDGVTRDILKELAGYLAQKLEHLRPDEAANARTLLEALRAQKLQQ